MDKLVTHLLQGTRARVVVAMAQRIASGESVADVAHDYTGDGEQVTAEELAEDFGCILRLIKERDDLRAQIAAVDAAIERNARIRRSEWTEDDRLFVADFTSEAAGFLAEMLLARLDMEKAPNYAEVRTEDLGSLHVSLTGLQIDMCFRRAGAPTPHELRIKAEKERDEALAETAEVQDAVRNTILDIIGAEHSNRIDGAGSDAGPVEFTVMEVRQGFEVMQERLDAALALAEERRLQIADGEE